jgi:hypothetical protein
MATGHLRTYSPDFVALVAGAGPSEFICVRVTVNIAGRAGRLSG